MATVQDPVCGMEIDPATAAGSSRWEGTTYYFCSAECKEKFEANPGPYARGERRDVMDEVMDSADVSANENFGA